MTGDSPYHWFDTPDGQTVRGYWDLRPAWREYFGNFDFSGKSVLELGPASGFLSLQMEADGAKVTSLEIPPGHAPDMLPVPGIKMDVLAKQQTEIIDRFRKDWRYYHSLFGSKNQVIYGDIYALSSLDRQFDVTTAAAILLHLANPFRAIQEAAKISQTIIVTDLQHPGIDGQGFMDFNPNPNSTDGAGWWLLSHGAISRMLTAVGFNKQRLSFSTHRLYGNPQSKNYTDHKFFTIVADRTADTKP